MCFASRERERGDMLLSVDQVYYLVQVSASMEKMPTPPPPYSVEKHELNFQFSFNNLMYMGASPSFIWQQFKTLSHLYLKSPCICDLDIQGDYLADQSPEYDYSVWFMSSKSLC